MNHEEHLKKVRVAAGVDENGTPMVELEIGSFHGCMPTSTARQIAQSLVSAANAVEGINKTDTTLPPFVGPVSSKGGRG